jgi:hypothetical protein
VCVHVCVHVCVSVLVCIFMSLEILPTVKWSYSALIEMRDRTGLGCSISIGVQVGIRTKIII